MDRSYPLVPIANFIACMLVLSSLSSSMLRTWNVGACFFAFWITTLAFIIGTDSIIWSHGVENVAPIWCDICEISFSPFHTYISNVSHLATHMEIGSEVGVPVSSFVIIRRLSLISRGRSASLGRQVSTRSFSIATAITETRPVEDGFIY